MRLANASYLELYGRSDGPGYSEAASYSRKESLKKGLVAAAQLGGISLGSYFAGWLIRELYFSSMITPAHKIEEKATKLEEPVRIPAYDEEKPFFLEEHKYVSARPVYYHEIFKERLKELPIIKDIPLLKEIPLAISAWIENTQNAIIEDLVKKYVPSTHLTIASLEAERAFQFLVMGGVPPERAMELAMRYYEKLLSSPGLREFVETNVRLYIAEPLSVYKMAALEADILGSAVGLGTFSTLAALAFKDEVRALGQKVYRGSKSLYKKILTGGKEEIEDE